MFGSKKEPTAKQPTMYEEQESRNANYQQEYEYRTIPNFIVVDKFDKMVNEAAAKGWELVNGCQSSSTTTHTAYMRRRLKP